MKITCLKEGESGFVKSVNCSLRLKKRLREMGLTEGVKITFIRRAPLGDPLEIKLRNFYLALRKETANSIEVEKI